MHNVTLVCTRHQALGNCNLDALQQIIKSLRPDVIFEELPPSFFDKYYTHKSQSNLESEAIHRYLETEKVAHIPVDLDEMPPKSLISSYRYMIGRIEGLGDINSFHFRTSIDTNKQQIETYGFGYLNSVYHDNYNQEILNVIEDGLKKLDNVELFKTRELWKAFQEKREHKMLQNIYNYSKEHTYNKAVFFLGALHRKSIMQKIEKYVKREQFKIHWSFYNP